MRLWTGSNIIAVANGSVVLPSRHNITHPHHTHTKVSHLCWPGFRIFRDYSCTGGSAQRLCLAGDTGWRGNKGGRAGIIRDQDPAVTTISLRVKIEMCRCTLLRYRKFLGLGREWNLKDSNYPYTTPSYTHQCWAELFELFDYSNS